jgi:mraZ protein
MMIGEYSHSLDAKGRINFPAKFREELGEQFYVTRWLDDCLVVFPNSEWNRISEILAEKSVVKSRDVLRYIYASATQAEPDKQGRILIPQNLREHARIEKEVVVIGVGTHAEIWNKDAWAAMSERMRSGPIIEAMEELEF